LYTVKPEAVKENIILYRAIEDISFTFDVKAKGLTAKKNDDNSISFYSPNNEVVFVIQSPYMTDSAEESALSADIELNLTETESGYKIDLIPDSGWIMSPDRVFPIYIDPTVSSSQEQTDIVDTYVHYGDAAGDHRLADRLVVGTKSGELCRSFIQTLIPSLPSGSYVTDARLNLSITYGTSTMQNLDVYRVNSTWSSSTMTWTIQNSISKTLVKTSVSSESYSNYPSSYRYSCDVTNTIIDIYNGARSNYGFMVKYSNESIDDYNRFYSSDYSTSTVRPVLVVSYIGDFYGDRPFVYYGVYDPETYEINCAGYALDYADWVLFDITDNELNNCSSEAELWNYTKSKVSDWLYDNMSSDYRIITSFTSNIYSNEWRIVFRMGYQDDGDGIIDIGPDDDIYDFHFWYQITTGQWAEKMGWSVPNMVSGTNGYTNPYYIDWPKSGNANFYDSSCAYYAIIG